MLNIVKKIKESYLAANDGAEEGQEQQGRTVDYDSSLLSLKNLMGMNAVRKEKGMLGSLKEVSKNAMNNKFSQFGGSFAGSEVPFLRTLGGNIRDKHSLNPLGRDSLGRDSLEPQSFNDTPVVKRRPDLTDIMPSESSPEVNSSDENTDKIVDALKDLTPEEHDTAAKKKVEAREEDLRFTNLAGDLSVTSELGTEAVILKLDEVSKDITSELRSLNLGQDSGGFFDGDGGDGRNRKDKNRKNRRTRNKRPGKVSRFLKKIPGAKYATKVGSFASGLPGAGLAKKGISSVAGGAGKLARGVGGLAKGAGKFLGPIGVAIASGLAVKDGFDGFKEANKTFDLKEGEEATKAQKITASMASIVSGLSFGLVDAKSLANKTYSFFNRKEKDSEELSAVLAKKQKLLLDTQDSLKHYKTIIRYEHDPKMKSLIQDEIRWDQKKIEKLTKEVTVISKKTNTLKRKEAEVKRVQSISVKEAEIQKEKEKIKKYEDTNAPDLSNVPSSDVRAGNTTYDASKALTDVHETSLGADHHYSIKYMRSGDGADAKLIIKEKDRQKKLEVLQNKIKSAKEDSKRNADAVKEYEAEIAKDSFWKSDTKEMILSSNTESSSKELAKLQAEYLKFSKTEGLSYEEYSEAVNAISKRKKEIAESMKGKFDTEITEGKDNLAKLEAELVTLQKPVAIPPVYLGLGSVSKKYETSGTGAGTVSSGVGDYGGKSYGSYQLASNTGTLSRYLKGSQFSDTFEGLKPGSKEFDKAWKATAKENPEAFEQDQQDFIKKTHYDPLMKNNKDKGLDLGDRGKAVQEALFSISVQHGSKTGLVEKALKDKDLSDLSDKEIVKLLFKERSKKDEAGNLAYFKSSSKGVQDGVANRFENEESDLLALASEPPPLPPKPFSAKDTSRIVSPDGIDYAGIAALERGATQNKNEQEESQPVAKNTAPNKPNIHKPFSAKDTSRIVSPDGIDYAGIAALERANQKPSIAQPQPIENRLETVPNNANSLEKKTKNTLKAENIANNTTITTGNKIVVPEAKVQVVSVPQSTPQGPVDKAAAVEDSSIEILRTMMVS